MTCNSGAWRKLRLSMVTKSGRGAKLRATSCVHGESHRFHTVVDASY